MGGASAGAGSMAPPSWTGAPGGMMAPEAANVTATPPSGDTSEESGDDSNSMAQVINKVGTSFSFLFFSFLSFFSFFLSCSFLSYSLLSFFLSSFHPLPPTPFILLDHFISKESQRILKNHLERISKNPKESHKTHLERISKNPKES